MRPARVLVLGLIGILLAAAFAMGALALVRGGLDEPSDVDDFPALVPSRTEPPASPSPGPSEIESPSDDDDQMTTSPSMAPTPSRTDTDRDDDRTDGDGDREGPGDDD